MLRPRPAVSRRSTQQAATGDEAERRLQECVARVVAVAGRLADVATHPQAARALCGLAQECVARRDVLRSRQALKARCSAALVGGGALQTLLRSPSAPAAAAAAVAASLLVQPQLGWTADEGVLAALAELLRSGDSAAAAAAVGALTQLTSARKSCFLSPAVAAVAASALCVRLAASGARAPWLACAFAISNHAAGLSALRKHAEAPAALASVLVDESLASVALTLSASCADGDDAFSASLLACDDGGIRRALHVALCGNSLPDAAAALRLLAALAPALPPAAFGAWAALAPDVAAAVRGAESSMHEAEVMAAAVAALFHRTQSRCIYGAQRAPSPWHAPLADAGVPAALLAVAQAQQPHALECWRAISAIAARGRVGNQALVVETAAAACAAARDPTWRSVPCGGYRFSPALSTGCGNLLLEQTQRAASMALYAVVRTEMEAGAPDVVVQALVDPPLVHTSAMLAAFSSSTVEDNPLRLKFAVQTLAQKAMGAGLRGTQASISALMSFHGKPIITGEIPAWGAWTPTQGDVRWCTDAATEASLQLRLIAGLLPRFAGDAPWRTPLMELLECLASPAGGLCGESRCWAALALRHGCGRCGARTNIGEDFSAALSGARFTDVELSCGEGGTPQPAHSSFLAARCPRLLPKRANGIGAATLRGNVPPAALSAVLSWVYSDSCDARALLTEPDALGAAVRLAKGAGLHTLAALLSNSLPHLGDDMPCLADDMWRSLDAVQGTADAQLLPGFAAPPVPVHRAVCAARCEYFRAALSPAFAVGENDAPVILRCDELCGAGAAALREWLYTGSVRAFEASAPPAVAVAARVAAAADVRLLPALATAARAHALAALAALQPAEAAQAASEAAAAGEWDIASAAVHAAAAAFPALRDDGTLDRLPPQLAEAIRQAHVQRASEAAA